MTGPDEPPADDPDDPGVLSSLPGTRPQRRSPKRAAVKPAASADHPSKPAPTNGRQPRPPRARQPPPAAHAPEPDAGLQPPEPDAGLQPPEPDAGLQPPEPDAGLTDEAPLPRRGREKPPAAAPAAAQGFEADPIEGTVDPPSGVELLSSVGKAATELAEIGLTLTRRLARSVLDRLPRL